MSDLMKLYLFVAILAAFAIYLDQSSKEAKKQEQRQNFLLCMKIIPGNDYDKLRFCTETTLNDKRTLR